VVAAARTSEDVQFWSTMSLTLAGTAQQLTSLLMIAAGVFLILDGRLSMGALIAANMLAGRVLAPISGIASVITRATQTVTSLRSINKLMSLERERPPGRTYLARHVRHGSIVFDNVKFKYPNAVMNALAGVSFSIAPGERVGIIGQIGSGKTTVGRLLTGLYDPDDGCILIDGVDLRQYDPRRPAPRHRVRPAGYRSALRQAARQYRACPSIRDREADSGSGAAGRRRAIRCQPPARL
jgi:ATP-binding cassette, subfamily C, bacterial LapB